MIPSHHHPEMKTFPNHVHLGDDKDAKESAPIDLQGVLEVLESEVGMQGNDLQNERCRS